MLIVVAAPAPNVTGAGPVPQFTGPLDVHEKLNERWSDPVFVTRNVSANPVVFSNRVGVTVTPPVVVTVTPYRTMGTV